MLVKTSDGSEVDVDFDANEDLIKTHFSGKGVLFKSQKDIDAEKEAAKTEGKSDATRDAHNDWEKNMSELFGEQKPNGVKGIEWAKTKISEISEKAKKATDAPDPKVKDEVAQAKIDELQKKLEQMEEGLTAKEKDAYDKAKNAGIKSAVRGLSVDGATDEEKRLKLQLLEQSIKSDYEWKLDEDTAQLVPYDKEGKPVINPKTTEPFTIDEIANEKYGFMLAKKAAPEPKKEGSNPKEFEVKKTKGGKEGIVAKNEVEIYNAARARALVAGTPEHTDFINSSFELSGLQQE